MAGYLKNPILVKGKIDPCTTIIYRGPPVGLGLASFWPQSPAKPGRSLDPTCEFSSGSFSARWALNDWTSRRNGSSCGEFCGRLKIKGFFRVFLNVFFFFKVAVSFLFFVLFIFFKWFFIAFWTVFDGVSLVFDGLDGGLLGWTQMFEIDKSIGGVVALSGLKEAP